MEFRPEINSKSFVTHQGEYAGVVRFGLHDSAVPTWGFTIWLNGRCVLGIHDSTWFYHHAKEHCVKALEEATEPEEPY